MFLHKKYWVIFSCLLAEVKSFGRFKENPAFFLIKRSKILILVVFVLLLFPEYEPLDKKKEEYINEDLAEQGNSQMVATTTMRVKGPKQIHKSMKKLIRNELCHIVRPYHKKLAV